MIIPKEIKGFFRENKCPDDESMACDVEQIIGADGEIVGLRIIPVNGGKSLNIRDIQIFG